jgi:hypothetical protein
MIEYNKFMNQKSNSKYDLEDRLIEFAVRIIDLAEALPGTVASKNLGSQIVRSGTSPALNYAEAHSNAIHPTSFARPEQRPVESAHSGVFSDEAAHLFPADLRYPLNQTRKRLNQHVVKPYTFAW